MRQVRLSQDVVSVGDLKVQVARLLKRVNGDRRAVVITQHGKPAGVLISIEDYDRLAEHDRFLEAVEQGLSESKRGRLIEDADLDKEIASLFNKSKKL